MWRCVCPFHKDDSDAIACRRALTFRHDGESDATVIKLKCWCLAGRMCDHARSPQDGSHVHMRWHHVPVIDAFVLDEVLEAAQQEVAEGSTWIFGGVGVPVAKAKAKHKAAAKPKGKAKAKAASADLTGIASSDISSCSSTSSSQDSA